MDYSEAEKALLHHLQTSLGPFENFVAKMDIEESLPLVPDRMYIIEAIAKFLNNPPNNVIIPIIGKVGQGKTHVCWQVNTSLKIKAIPVFFEIPTDSKLFYYNLYTELVENLGAERLRDLSIQISDLWGAQEKKYGLFRTSNVDKVLVRAKDTSNFQKSAHSMELEDCMRIIITHAIDPDKSHYAERWLLGDVMDPDELYYLGVSNNLNAPFIAKELLHLILQFLPEGLLLIIDDLDESWARYNSPEFIEDDWTQSYVTSSEETEIVTTEIPEFFREISQLFLDFPNLHLLCTFKPKNEKEILTYFSPIIQSNSLVTSIILPNFSLEDLKEYYKLAIRNYCKENHLLSRDISSLFPFSREIFQRIYEISHGNPRKIIRKLQDAFDYLLYDRESLEEIENLL